LALPFWIAIAAVAIGQFVLSRTVFGRYVVAIGTNEEAVRLSGISTKRVKVAVFAISGLLAGAGAVINVSRSQSANPNAGTGLELDVIAAVVIGGTSLFGGVGSVFGTVIGSILIGVLINGLVLMNVSSYIQQIIIGVIIVFAVAFDQFAKSRRRI
jgi:inositol transport system permease protein